MNRRPYAGLSKRDRELDAQAMAQMAREVGPLLDAGEIDMNDAAEDLTHTVSHFHAAARWTGVRDNEREKWLALRQTIVTASDCAAIMGADPWRDALEVYASKVLDRIGGPELPDINKPTFWGKLLEQPILRGVSDYYGWDYMPGGALLVSRQHAHLGATLDAEINRKDGHGWADNEGKTSVITKDWDEESGSLPLRVLIQVQHQLLVTGAPYAMVFALLQGCRPCQVEVFPNDAFHVAIIDASLEFMERIKNLDAPLAGPCSDRVLYQMFPTHSGKTVPLPLDAMDWTREIFAIRKQEAELARKKKTFQNLLKQSIGGFTFGELPEPIDGKRYWRLVEQQREGYVVEPTSFMAMHDLKAATLSGEKKSTGETSFAAVDPENDDLAPGETVKRVHGRRR